MPEFMGKKITRAQESARHAYRKALAKAVRDAAKGTGWRSIEGGLFQQRSGWFVGIRTSVHIYEEVTKASVSVKPMAIDPIFWDITGLPENRDAPLSFRFNGAWACRPPDFAEIDIPEQDDVSAVAAHLVATADDQLDRVIMSWTPTAFLLLCQTAGSERGSYLSCVVTMLVAMERDDEALAACEEAILNHQDGGFLTPDGTFAQMAREWLRLRISARTVN